MAKELDALLKQVDELEARGLARQCFDGIAVGRNADELHLAERAASTRSRSDRSTRSRPSAGRTHEP